DGTSFDPKTWGKADATPTAPATAGVTPAADASFDPKSWTAENGAAAGAEIGRARAPTTSPVSDHALSFDLKSWADGGEAPVADAAVDRPAVAPASAAAARPPVLLAAAASLLLLSGGGAAA